MIQFLLWTMYQTLKIYFQNIIIFQEIYVLVAVGKATVIYKTRLRRLPDEYN